jgi:RHS repeat-associated protein
VSARFAERKFTVSVAVAALVAGLVPALMYASGANATETPSAVVFSTQPGSGAPGTNLSPQPVVKTVNGTGGTVATSDVVSLTLTGPAGAALTSAAALTCPSATASSGVATFAGCKVDRGGMYTLTATDGTLTAVSSSFFVSGPSQLIFTTQPSGGTAGSAFATQPEVTIADAHGDPVATSTANVTLGIKAGTGAPGAALSCTAKTLAATAGVAHFSGCKIDRSGANYKLVAIDVADELISAPSSEIDVTAGTPSQLSFAPQPAGAVGGVAFATQPVVTIQDSQGNAAIGNDDTVTLAIKSGTGTSGAQLTCPAATADDGVATFAGCKIDRAGSGYVLVATDSAASLTSESAAFSVGAGGATGVSFTTQPGGGPGGAAFTQQPVVKIADAGGNPVPGSVALTIVPGTGTSGAALNCAANPAAAPTGTVTFAGCAITLTGSNYKLRATSGAFTVDSAAFDVSAGVPAELAFSTQPGNGTGGSALSAQPVIDVNDAGGNSAAGAVTLALAPGTGAPGATLTCADNSVSAVNGVATFAGCAVDKIGTGYRLVASSGTARQQSAAFDVSVGSAAQLAFTTQPGGGTGGAAWSAQPVVTVQDAGGNQVRSNSESIRLSIASGTGPGHLSCTATTLAAIRGAARFDGCRIDRTASAYRLEAIDSADGLNATSHAFAVAAGPAAQLVFSGQPGGSSVGATFPAQPQVTVVDRGGNPAGSATVSLAATPGTGTGGALACDANTVDASPTASFSGCAIGTAGSGYTLTAAAGDLHAESAPFAVLLPPPGPLGQAPANVPVAQTFGGMLYAYNPTNVTDGVNTATGQFTFSRTDLTVAGIGVPFTLARAYNSADATGGSFGRGWTSLFDLKVTIAANKSTATVRGEDGQQVVFTANAAGGWTAPPGARSSLSCNSNACAVTRFDGYRFDATANGKVLDYLSPNGTGLKFAWTASSVAVTVRTTAKTPLVVTGTLDSAGRITKLTTPTRSVTYAYSAAGLLTGVRDVRGGTWTYGYSSNRFSTETDPLGAVRLTADYNADGRVTATTRKGSSRHIDDTFEWGANTGTRKVLTSVNGTVQRETYVDEYVGNVLVKQTNPLGAAVRYSYDSRVNLVEIQDPMGWVQEFSYDAANNLIRSSSPISSTSAAVVTMTYDSTHRLLTSKDADGNTTTQVYNGSSLGFVRPPGVTPGTGYTYDGAGNLTKIQTGVGQQVFAHDAAGNLTGVQLQTLKGVSLNGKGTLATFDEAGNRLTSVDPRGNLATVDPAFRSTWSYDQAGNPLSQTQPGPITTSQTYDGAGDLKTTTNAMGTTTNDWDESTRTLTMTGPGSRTVTQTFDPSGNVLTETDSASHRTTTHAYDAAGRETSTTDPAGVVSDYGYDVEGNVVSASDSLGDTLSRQFDSLNRQIRQVSNGVETRTAYDPAGNVIAVTDASGAVTRATWNSHGKIASVKTDAGTTTYAYEPGTDELLSVTDGNGHVTSFAYDAAARRISSARNGNVTRYGYDLASNVNSTTDPDGRNTAITFNALNRPTRTVNTQAGKASVTVTQAYDAFGRRTAMTDALGSHSYAYDAAGNLTSASVPGGTFTYDYSHAGKIVETYPDGTVVKYGVDDAQKLMSVESGAPGTDGYVKASYVRDPTRQTTGLAYSNGVFATQTYDAAGNVLDQQLRNASGALADDTFTYDAGGNRLTQRNTVGGTTTANKYGYDATGRLTSFKTASGSGTLTGATVPTATAPATAPDPSNVITGGGEIASAFGVNTSVNAADGTQTGYGYDAVGNRTSRTGPGTQTTSFDAADQVAAQTGAGAAAWTHDHAGNVTKIGSKTFGYDAAGRLTSVTVGGSTITYQYDGDGNRIVKSAGSSTTKYTWDPFGALPQLVLEKTGGGDLIRRYIYGDGPVAMQTPTATYFFHLDPIGSVNELTDSSGNIAAEYHYDAFGNVSTTGPTPPTNPLLFQGQYLDTDTGLYYMRARYYDPQSGRFLARDPQAQSVGVPSESAYVFASNRPTVLTDPTGRTTTTAVVFQGSKTTDEGNAVNNTNLAVSGTKLGLKAVSKVGGYSAAVSQAALSAKIGAELAPEAAAAAKVGGKIAKIGAGLAVVGVLLQIAVTVLDCLYGDAYTCAGSVVGTVIGVGFTIGCTFISSGIGAAACAFVGVALSVGLQYIITNFGPDIVDGLVTGALFLADALPAVGAAIADFAEQAGGAIVSGFNDATTAISSGFDTAMKTLVGAGYAAAELATVLADAFAQDFNEAVAGLIGLGYALADIADSAISAFNATAAEFAGLLKDGFNYTADQISNALSSAYETVAAETGQILKDIGFAVGQVADALKSTYDLVASETAAILDDIGYGFNQIADALGSVYAQTDQLVAQVLSGLGATAQQVAAALRDFYADLGDAAAAALKFADYAVGEIAGALDTAYHATAQAVATILNGLAYGATAIAGALKDAFHTLDVETAQILKTVGFALLEVADALRDAFNDAAQAAASALRTIGYTVIQVGTALKTAFTQAAAAAATILRDIGYDVIAVADALKDAFNEAATAVAGILDDIGYAVSSVANALKDAFTLGAQAAADILLDLFTTNQVATVLSSVYLQTAEQVATIYKALALTLTQIANVLSSVFNQAADAVASILQDIGATAAEIAGILENVFNQAVSDIANLLSSMGFNNDTINAIGGAFESFGQSVADCFSSFFSDC